MDVTILGIETSCDETSAAVVRNGREILSNVVFSQIEDHSAFGGVVPEVASRRHLETIIPVVGEAFKQAGISPGDICAVSATYGPGLVGALLVGLSFAKGLARALGVPFIGVHHVAAHILAASLMGDQSPAPPFTALVASGGHSSIYFADDYRSFRLVGMTRDDAAGEAFDKVARATGLGYPGGPKLEAAARGGNTGFIRFPRTSFKDGTYDFSFSGVKTAAINYLKKMAQDGGMDAQNNNAICASENNMRDFYASYQDAIVDALAANTLAAEREHGSGKIVVAGGVAANGALRERLYGIQEAGGGALRVFFPPPRLCTDNAAMVAARAYHDYAAGAFSPLTLNASASAPI